MEIMKRCECPYRSAPAYRCTCVSSIHALFTAIQTYLGEKVVSEKEYLSAMMGLVAADLLVLESTGL